MNRINISATEAPFPLRKLNPLRFQPRAGSERVAFFALVVLLGTGWLGRPVFAQASLAERLSGFDSARVEKAGRWVQQPNNPAALEEAAKLVYQLRRIDEQSLRFPLSAFTTKPGNAVRLRGTATHLASLPLPQELADLLEMPRLFRVTVDVDGTERSVMTAEVPRRWLQVSANSTGQAVANESDSEPPSESRGQGSRTGWSCAIEGIACSVNEQGQPIVLAAAAMQWYPTTFEQAGAVGAALLARYGFDARFLDQIAASQQQPLQSDEREAFYGMLLAAGKLDTADAPSPEATGTVELLQRPQELTGHWIRVPLQTVRITRVAVTNAGLLDRLGQDHYWQIDGTGDLGDLVVTVEVEGEGGRRAGDEPPQATFANRYPVSVAALRLPDELRDRMERESGAGAVMAMLRQPITVDGFYYRLWSYDSEYMQQSTGRQQFGPLLMASRIRVEPPAQGDPRGAAMIGWIAAAVFLVAVAVVIAALWWAGRRDDEVTRRRRTREAEDVHFPTT